ncbi:capsid cement protein, partial [Klebsiella pneumoniae]
ADEIKAGKKVYFKAGKVQLEATGAVFAGVAWEDAGSNSTVIDVKINA